MCHRRIKKEVGTIWFTTQRPRITKLRKKSHPSSFYCYKNMQHSAIELFQNPKQPRLLPIFIGPSAHRSPSDPSLLLCHRHFLLHLGVEQQSEASESVVGNVKKKTQAGTTGFGLFFFLPIVGFLRYPFLTHTLVAMSPLCL